MATATLIAHCGGKLTTRDDVRAVETPKATTSYTPVDYEQLLTMVEDMADSVLGMPVLSQEYALSNGGNQLFAAYTFDHGEETDAGLSIGVRTSHDKSLPVGIVGGSRVFVCDNLAFTGESMRVVRRHTKNVWEDVQGQIAEGINSAVKAHDLTAARWEKMAEIGLAQDDGYALLGRATGREIIRSQQMSRALKSWRGEFKTNSLFPKHGQTLYGLYQALTEGAKATTNGTRRMVQLVEIDRFMRQTAKALLDVDSPAQLPEPQTGLALEID